MKIRDVGHTLIDAPPALVDAVVAAERLPTEDGYEAWYVTEPTPSGGTRLTHGVAYTPRTLVEQLLARRRADGLRVSIERELDEIKRLAEKAERLPPAL